MSVPLPLPHDTHYHWLVVQQSSDAGFYSDRFVLAVAIGKLVPVAPVL